MSRNLSFGVVFLALAGAFGLALVLALALAIAAVLVWRKRHTLAGHHLAATFALAALYRVLT
jgi:hypothetical protein